MRYLLFRLSVLGGMTLADLFREKKSKMSGFMHKILETSWDRVLVLCCCIPNGTDYTCGISREILTCQIRGRYCMVYPCSAIGDVVKGTCM